MAIFARQAHAAAAAPLRVRARRRDSAFPADRLGHRARSARLLPQSGFEGPRVPVRLAAEAGFSASPPADRNGEQVLPAYAGQVPLLLKLNSKTDIPPADEALSPCNASVEDAVRLGADAVGYTLYVGSPRQEEDFMQVRQVRQDCDRFGMPLVIWAYPRGRDIETKGGRDSFFAIDYAARVAMEMGADVVQLYAQAESRQGQGRTGSIQRDGGHPGRGDPPVRRGLRAVHSWCCRAAPRSTTTSSSPSRG